MIKFCNLMALLRKNVFLLVKIKFVVVVALQRLAFCLCFRNKKCILTFCIQFWTSDGPFSKTCAFVSHSKYLSSEVSRSFRCDCPLQFLVRMTRICCWAWRMMFSGKSKWKRFLCNFQEWWGVVDIRCMWVQSLGDKIWLQWSCACVQPYIDVMSTLAAAQAECFCVHLMIVFAHGAVLMFLRGVCGDAR